MSSDAGISSHISESSAQDAFSAQAPPLASPPAQAPLLMAGEVEKDTLEDEDALLGGLEIVPPGAFWTENKLASFGINNRLLKSWLKQPSPCCAAASVAGSWNALCDMGRRDADSVTIQNVLDVYITLVQAQIERLSGSFRRKLGGSGDFDAFLADIEKEALNILDEKAASTEGGTKKTKAKKLTKKIIIKAVNKVIEAFLATYSVASSSDSSSVRLSTEESAPDLSQQVAPPYIICLREFIQSQEEASAASAQKGGAEVGGQSAEDEDEEDESDEEEDEEEGGADRSGGPSDSAQVGRESRSSNIMGSASMDETPRFGAAAPQKCETISLEALDGALTKMTSNAQRLLPMIAKKGPAEVIEIPAAAPKGSKGGGSGGFKAKKAASASTSTAKATRKAEAKIWNWAWDLRGILHKRLGLYRLQNKECPSTTIIGNWGILEAAPLLSESRGLGSSGFTAALFMGKKLKGGRALEYPVSASDDKAMVAKQWSALCGAFQREDCILLYHLKNHYAPIYAVKEWTERKGSSNGDSDTNIGGCVTHRQVLTARKGQRPTTWIEFDEVRSTLLTWDGYKIMILSRGTDVTSADMRMQTINAKRSAASCIDVKG